MTMMIPHADLHKMAVAKLGHKPKTHGDWKKIVRTWAELIGSNMEVEACLLMSRIIRCPLEQIEVFKIAESTAKRKKIILPIEEVRKKKK